MFAERVTHASPPTAQIGVGWQPELEVLVKEPSYPTISTTVIELRLRAFVELLAKA